MASPNEGKLLNFVAKVYDPIAKTYKPIYIAPDATNAVQGDVRLSDATNSTLNAATGMTAATPAAVKAVQDNANNKLDKTTTTAQSVKSAVTFTGAVTGNGGFKGNLTGDVTGTADYAKALTPGRSISVKAGANGTAGTATFTGASNITVTIPNVDASAVTVGTLPLSVIPQGAIEKVVSYASVADAISAYNAAAANDKPFQMGDTVRITGVTPNVMYSVVGDPAQTASYVEYAAGTATNALNAEHADVASKVGTATVGGTAKPVYINAGTATACSATVGSGIKPVYMNAGTITASNSTVGGAAKPVYMNAGTVTACSSTVGNATKPVYMNAGTITVGTYELHKTVPADAKFTDTTYAAFKGATASANGSSGLVPAPTSAEHTKFLRADGTWAVAGAVTGVKGNSETNYRTGNVNITAANVGALATGGGTVSGTLVLSKTTDASGTANNSPALIVGGSATAAHLEFDSNEIMAKTNGTAVGDLYINNDGGKVHIGAGGLTVTGTITGDLNGNATTATSATKATTATTASKLGSSNVGSGTKPIYLNAGTATASSSTVGSASEPVYMNAGAITAVTSLDGSLVTANSIGLGKLASDVGTVAVSNATPTDSNVKVWIKV